MSFYRFPTQIQSIERVSSQFDLKQKLISQTLCDGTQFRNNHMRYINIMQYQGKYVYARCLFKYKQCPWRLFYRRKIYKNKKSQDILQIWQQTGDYIISMRYSNLFHNHMPFDANVPNQKNPPHFISIWTVLHKYINFTTLQIHKYSKDYSKIFLVPGSISRRRSNQVDVYLNNLSFPRWVKNIKINMNLDILYYPTDKNIQPPQIVIITARKSFEISAWHGQVIGIKKIDPKILQYSTKYQGYKALVFYQFIPGWKRIAYMFAIYSQGNYKQAQNIPFNNIFNMSNPDYTQNSTTPKYRKSCLNNNIYKLIRIFLSILGSKVRTFVIDYDQQMIDCVQYLTNQINNQKKHKYKLNWIVDPTYYFADVTGTNDVFCSKIVHNLMKTCSQFQYLHLYKQYWETIDQNQADVKNIIQHFHLHHKSLLPFAGFQPIYTGGWFQHSDTHQKCLQLLIQRQKDKKPMVTVLDGIARYMIQQVKTYQHRPTMIMNIYYQKAYPFTYMKQARINMMKKGFFLLVGQSLQVNTINFVHPSNFTILKTGNMKKLQEQIDNLFKNQYPIQREQQIIYRDSMLQRSSWYAANSRYNNKIKLKLNKNSQQQNIYNHDPISHSHINSISQQQSKISSDRFQRYQQIFPLQPTTLIKTTTPLPPYLQIEDKGQIYICKLIIKSQQWFKQYAKDNYICTKVDQSYYRVEYQCSCGFREIKGIPCRHLLKICIKHDLAVYPYVESYWKFKESKAQWNQIKCMMIGVPVPHVGRPKLSHRRNRKRYSPGINLVQGYYCEGQRLQIK